jgi:hypothetical protein
MSQDKKKNEQMKKGISRKPCTVKDCDRFNLARGLCALHYYRLRNTGTLSPPVAKTKKLTQCQVRGCIALSFIKGHCRYHYQRLQRYGTATYKGRNRSLIDRRIRHCFFNVESRCQKTWDKKYSYYGGRGIKNELTLEDIIFLWVRDNAKKMKQPSIDRKDANGNYTLENCRFIEMDTNRRNRWQPSPREGLNP